MKKRFLTLSLALLIIASTLSAPIYAENSMSLKYNKDSNGVSQIQTNEESMPIININHINSKTSNTSSVPERVEWIKKTKNILESAYNQKIAKVTEDKDYITFEYEYVDVGIEDLTKEHLLKTKYVKPESELARSSIPTKMNYGWSWSDDYYRLDEKSGLWGTAKNLTLTIAGATVKSTLANVFLSMLGFAESQLSSNTPVYAKSTVKYYYLNKIGYVKESAYGYWLPYSYVGSRRGFKRILGQIKDEYGQPITENVDETIGRPSKNPTNYDSIEKKRYFDDNTWILNKAVQQYQDDAGVYSDIYSIGKNITPDLP